MRDLVFGTFIAIVAVTFVFSMRCAAGEPETYEVAGWLSHEKEEKGSSADIESSSEEESCFALSVEELLEQDVTSVSKKPERLSKAPAVL